MGPGAEIRLSCGCFLPCLSGVEEASGASRSAKSFELRLPVREGRRREREREGERERERGKEGEEERERGRGEAEERERGNKVFSLTSEWCVLTY